MIDHVKLRTLALAAPAGPYQLQTSNSFRRIGTQNPHYCDGSILYATTHRSDGHPDLQGAPGVLEYITAADPTTVLSILDERDRLMVALRYLRANLPADCDEVFEAASTIAKVPL